MSAPRDASSRSPAPRRSRGEIWIAALTAHAALDGRPPSPPGRFLLTGRHGHTARQALPVRHLWDRDPVQQAWDGQRHVLRPRDEGQGGEAAALLRLNRRLLENAWVVTLVRPFATLRYEKRGAVAVVALDRPEVLNAYNVAMRDDLHAALGAADEDPEVRALVLCGRAALAAGLVQRVVARARLEAAALALARRLVRLDPAEVQALRRAVRGAHDLSLEAGIALERRLALALQRRP